MFGTSSELIVEQEFDSFCKKVIRNYARDIYDMTIAQNSKSISLELLTQSMLEQFAYVDAYTLDTACFAPLDYEVSIEDIMLAKAIESLSEKQQDIILLSFFLEMSDVDIANVMNFTERTIRYNKDKALELLKLYMEEHCYEN